MTCHAFGLVATALVAMASTDGAKEDREKIQGTWVLVSSERDGVAADSAVLKARNVRMVFEEDRVLAKMGDRAASLGTFTLDPSKTPKAYDRAYPDGSPRRGIYRIEGDQLTICIGDLGRERPKSFTRKAGDGATLIVYKRE